MRVVSLTTDFGLQDWFVGAMKGVLFKIHPAATIVDITHGIPPGAIQAGAFALAAAFSYFPLKTIHVAVVDPGVGSERSPIVVETARFLFVGPDNGVLSLALAQERVQRIVRVEKKKYQLGHLSQTFHGRDVFAPVAAHLSRGISPEKLGPRLADYERLVLPIPAERDGAWIGSVLYIDRFGNAITNLAKDLSIFEGKSIRVFVPGKGRAIPIRPFYQAVPLGKPLALFGSTGNLEIAIHGGNAAQRLRLAVGDTVIVKGPLFH